MLSKWSGKQERNNLTKVMQNVDARNRRGEEGRGRREGDGNSKRKIYKNNK